MKFFTRWIENKETSVVADLASLFLIFGIAFFQFLGSIPLLDPDEGRYAEIPREMLERGDFITPYLNYVKYFEKPPLHYWLNALSFKIFGLNEFGARFPGALMGLLTVLLTYYVGRKIFGRLEGVLAALVLGTAMGFVAQARIDITDVTLTFFMSACLGSFLLAVRSAEPRKSRYYYLFYASAALAVLAKGLIGFVLPGAILFFFLLLTGQWRILKEMRLPSGILLFLGIASPWFIAVSLKNPEFPYFFFVHEHFQRFLTKVHHRYQPFWFFIPVLFGTMLPWSFFIPISFRQVWKERKSPEGGSRLYLVIWFAVIFLFFSKSNSKLIPYILPVFPPLSLLIAYMFSRCWNLTDTAVRVVCWILGVILIIAGIGGIAYPFVSSRPAISIVAALVLGGTFLVEGTLTCLFISRVSLRSAVFSIVLCSFAIGITAPSFILPGVAEKKSFKKLGDAAREQMKGGAVLATVGLEQGFTFYAQRRIIVVGDKGEIEFGSNQGDQAGWFLDMRDFARLWDTRPAVYAVMSPTELQQFRKMTNLPAVVLESAARHLLITNSATN